MRVNIHMYPSTFTCESRMLRITGSLVEAEVFEQIHILAMWEEGLPERESLDATRTVWRVRTPLFGSGGGLIRKTCRFMEWTARCLWKFRGQKVACVNPHSLSMLPLALAFRLFMWCKIVYDTHEFEPETINNHGIRQFFSKVIEWCSMPFLDTVVVTTDGYGRLYEERYGIRNVVVVKNYPLRFDSNQAPAAGMKQKLGIPDDALLFVYQGLLAQGRGIDLLLGAFEQLGPKKHLVFLGFGPLQSEVEQIVAHRPNIHFLPGVAPLDVVKHVSTADVGFCLIERTCLSYYHTLPNKMLECLQGGVPVVVSDFPDMGGLVTQHECGWTTAVDPASLVGVLRGITAEEVARKKEFAQRWATSFHWEVEAERYLDMMRNVVGSDDVLILPHPDRRTMDPVSTSSRIAS